MPLHMPLLILNAGSSSLKFTLIDPATEQVSRRGTLDISPGTADAAKDSARSNSAVQALLDSFDGRILGVAHRVVHGGAVFSSPVRLTPEVCDALSKLTPMAPLHNPPSLTVIDAAMKVARRPTRGGVRHGVSGRVNDFETTKFRI
jgi:acetate kinase